MLRWALDLFGRAGTQVPAETTRNEALLDTVNSLVTGAGRKMADFGDLAEMYSAASPSTDAEKALVVAAWFQYREQMPEVDTQAVNTRLKHLGYPVGNITRAFDYLRDSRPSLVVQMKKMGTSQQARKKYRVTVEGAKEVERLIAQGAK